MKEKIRNFLIAIAEIGTVAWAINGMWKTITLNPMEKEVYFLIAGKGTNLYWLPLLFYFLSALLILYLLRKYERKN